MPLKSMYVTRSEKTGLIATITYIHFLSVCESCTHALPRNTKYLITDTSDSQVCFYRQLFRVHFKALESINSIGWGTKLLLMAILASLVDCISLRMSHTEGMAILFELKWVL